MKKDGIRLPGDKGRVGIRSRHGDTFRVVAEQQRISGERDTGRQNVCHDQGQCGNKKHDKRTNAEHRANLEAVRQIGETAPSSIYIIRGDDNSTFPHRVCGYHNRMDERIWQTYEDGATIGQTGLVGGIITRDEELGDPEEPEDADARVTLEALPDGFAVTVNLYGGWLQETARFESESGAQSAFDAAKPALFHLADRIPGEDDAEMDAAVEALNREIAAFTVAFGGEPTI